MRREHEEGTDLGEVDTAAPDPSPAHARTAPATEAPAAELGSAGTLPQPELGRTEPAALRTIDAADYELGRELARGGMGRIRIARDRRHDRPVAIKELLGARADLDTRFRREALITARLQHPSIVPVYEAGQWTTGEPFYAMKLVDGRPLDTVIAGSATLADRLALLPNVIAVADALAYAHDHHVIHRDLKPANVLVGTYGETVVIDWGLAKDLEAADADEVSEAAASDRAASEDLTRLGQTMGTPAYMPPEQARGEPVDKYADVYALGALLYHVLAGAPPYSGASADEILDAVEHTPPVPLGERQPGVPGDLLAIVARAMEREPAKRYRSARELAEDLKKFQTGQLVGVREYSWLALLARWIRRHRAVVAVAGVALVVVIVGAVLSVHAVMSERDAALREQRAAKAANASAQRRSEALTFARARELATTDPTSSIAWLSRVEDPPSGWGGVRTVAANAAAKGIAYRVVRTEGDLVRCTSLAPTSATLLTGHASGALRVWPPNGGEPRVVQSSPSPAVAAVWISESRVLALHHDHGLALVDLTTSQLQPIAAPPDSTIELVDSGGAFARAPDGVHRYDVASGSWQRVAPGPLTPSTMVAFRADGRAFAVERPEAMTIEIYDLTGDHVTVQRERTALDVRAGVIGAQYLAIVSGEFVEVYELRTGKRQKLPTRRLMPLLAMSRDGARLAMLAPDGDVEVRTLANAAETWRRKSPVGEIASLAFAPDGAKLFVNDAHGSLAAWTVRDGDISWLSGHRRAVAHVVGLPDGSVVSAAGDELRFWRLDRPTIRVLGANDDTKYATAMTYSPDGALRAAFTSGVVYRVHAGSGAPTLIAELGGPLYDATFAADGRRFVGRSFERGLSLVDEASGAQQLGDLGKARAELSPSGRWLAIVDQAANALVLQDTRSGARTPLLGHTAAVSQTVFSPDETQLVTTDLAGGIWSWTPGRTEGANLRSRGATAFAVEFLDNGTRFATSSTDGTVQIWDHGTQQHLLRGHARAVTALAADRSRGRLASGGTDGNVVVWDVARVIKLATLEAHDAAILRIAFVADGERLAVLDEARTLRLWDLASGTHRVVASCYAFAVHPSGEELACNPLDGGVVRIRDDLPREREALQAWLRRATTAIVQPEGDGE